MNWDILKNKTIKDIKIGKTGYQESDEAEALTCQGDITFDDDSVFHFSQWDKCDQAKVFISFLENAKVSNPADHDEQ